MSAHAIRALPRRALLIVNARSRIGKESLDSAVEGLLRHGIEPTCRDCGSRDALSPLIAEHGRDADMIVVGGGDGTLSAAAAGVIARQSGRWGFYPRARPTISPARSASRRISRRRSA